jgi:hypothetical protein
VFCASLADVFEDRPELIEPRRRLAGLIRDTPHLDWLLLTKRPGNARRMIPEMWAAGAGWPRNYWVGASVEDQERADERIPELLEVPAPVLFLSIEPLLGPIEFATLAGVSWVIVGGESGPKARPCDLGWIRSIIGQCRSAGVAPFVKQLGGRPIGLRLTDRKGGEPAEWPEDLRVREFPRPPSLEAAGSPVAQPAAEGPSKPTGRAPGPRQRRSWRLPGSPRPEGRACEFPEARDRDLGFSGAVRSARLCLMNEPN